MNTNPAGIGLYRSNEISTSFGFNNTQTKSGTYDSDKTRWSWDQLGFVYSHQIGTATDLRFVNFGFNYHKSKNFNRAFAMQQDLRGFGYTDGYGRSWTASQTQQMANMVGLLSAGQIDDVYNYGDVEGLQNPYNVYDYPYLGVMGIRSELVGIRYHQLIPWFKPQGGDSFKVISGDYVTTVRPFTVRVWATSYFRVTTEVAVSMGGLIWYSSSGATAPTTRHTTSTQANIRLFSFAL